MDTLVEGVARKAAQETLNGVKGRWVTIHGRPVFIDEQGNIRTGHTARVLPLRKPGTVRKGFRAATPGEIKTLKIPPKWTDVQIAEDPASDLQVVGVDSMGRQQYRYSAAHTERQSLLKFARLLAFNKAHGSIMERIRAEVRDGDEAALVLRVIAATGFRVGGRLDRGKTPAFGASTLQERHIHIKGDQIDFDFVGKKGVQISRRIQNRELAELLSKRLTGDPEAFLFPNATQRKVLAAMKRVAGEEFLVKDFRTYVANAEALVMIRRMGTPKDAAAAKKARREVGRHVSEILGNTPTVALADYIDPRVFQGWREAGLIEAAQTHEEYADVMADFFETTHFDELPGREEYMDPSVAGLEEGAVQPVALRVAAWNPTSTEQVRAT